MGYIERIVSPDPEPIVAAEDTVAEFEATDTAAIVEIPEPDAEIAVERFRYPVCALRSNLLLPLLNVGLEVPLGNRWSASVDYYYPWSWRKSGHKNCFELIFISAEARYCLAASTPRTPRIALIG